MESEEDVERKCVGCKKTDDPHNLERFVLVEEFGLVFDLRGKAPGRGAYSHPDLGCISGGIDGGFARSFKAEVSPKPAIETFVSEVANAIRTRLDESLRVAMRAGRLAVGGGKLEDAMKANDVSVVLIAKNCGASTDRKFRSNAQRKSILVLDGLAGEELAKPLGKTFVGVIGVSEASAFQIKRDWAALQRLGFFDGGVEVTPEHG